MFTVTVADLDQYWPLLSQICNIGANYAFSDWGQMFELIKKGCGGKIA